jgi:hypothetical protein
LRRFELGAAFGEPAGACGDDLEVLMADGLALQLDGELALVLGKNAGLGRAFFLVSDTGRGAAKHHSYGKP